MANYARLARPYAKATFSLALETNTLDHWQQGMRAISDSIAEPDIARTLRSSAVSRVTKQQLLAGIGDEQIQALLSLLIANDRIALLPSICDAYEALRREHEAVEQIEIASPTKLDDAMLQSIAAKMEATLGKKVRISQRIDESLLAGAVIQGDGWVIEGSMRKQLAQLARKLAA